MRTWQLLYLLTVALCPLSEASGDETSGVDSTTPSWFSRLDRDGNGVLNREEASRLFVPMDANQDGQVTVTEATDYAKTRVRSGTRAGNRKRTGPILQVRELASREKTGNGLWVVSIGHSCVVPAIRPFAEAARTAGYDNHTQIMQFAGAAGGAPKAQWNRSEETQDAKRALSTGRIDVMTFGHLVLADGRSVGCDVEDYERWIQFAIKHNPNIKFYIQDLWPWLPGAQRSPVELEEFNLEDYEASMAVSSKSVADVVEELNQKYAGRVRVIPVGPAMTELVRRVTKNALPGVDAVLVPPQQARDRVGLYRDRIHPTNVVASLEGYVYYACLYERYHSFCVQRPHHNLNCAPRRPDRG